MTACVCAEFSASLKNFEEVLERIDADPQISRTLKQNYFHARSGLSVWKCSECGADWAAEQPFPEAHGGGPSCFFQIASADRHALAREYQGEILQWRKNHEDRQFLQTLEPECGPEKCSVKGCELLRVAGSSKCRAHHFKMIRGYELKKFD